MYMIEISIPFACQNFNLYSLQHKPCGIKLLPAKKATIVTTMKRDTTKMYFNTSRPLPDSWKLTIVSLWSWPSSWVVVLRDASWFTIFQHWCGAWLSESNKNQTYCGESQCPTYRLEILTLWKAWNIDMVDLLFNLRSQPDKFAPWKVEWRGLQHVAEIAGPKKYKSTN